MHPDKKHLLETPRLHYNFTNTQSLDYPLPRLQKALIHMNDSNLASVEPTLSSSTAVSPQTVDSLVEQLKSLDSRKAAQAISALDANTAAEALRRLSPVTMGAILEQCAAESRDRITVYFPSNVAAQVMTNATFPKDSIGRLMDPPVALFKPEDSVASVIAELREIVKKEFVTYVYIVDDHKKLIGLVVMRDLLFADPTQRLSEITLSQPFALNATTPLMDGMKEVLLRHYPVYPVVNNSGELLGLVRGFRLFEAQAVEISAQAGSMVGVEKEERVSTSLLRSFSYRHPWLQLNLLTAFVAGAVVSFFQETIDQVVVLASFLPVLAGQSGNTGCQALAVTLRGMTLGDLDSQKLSKVISKEALLGAMNGALVGLSAALGMYILASSQSHPAALTLSTIVFIAMIGSCLVSGLSGTLVPLALRKVGADPATASSIFLTTATDVVSMGLLLSLASVALM
jgi:magnesium transporter